MWETFCHKYYESYKCEKHLVTNVMKALNVLEISQQTLQRL